MQSLLALLIKFEQFYAHAYNHTKKQKYYFSCDIGTGKEGLKKYISDVVVIQGTSIRMFNRRMKVVKSIRADLGRGR